MFQQVIKIIFAMHLIKKSLFFIYLFFVFTSQAQVNDVLKLVNPFIGTGGHGHTFPGATVPFGMVQLSPDTRIDGSWDGCGGYHYSDSIIYGFSHTHLSGTGVSDYGDIMLMPTLGTAKFKPTEYGTKFKHENEKASPGFYAVQLNNGISCEFTVTTRVGLHKYEFPATTDSANLLLDFTHRDMATEVFLKIENEQRISGMRRSKAWAQDQLIYFVMDFSDPILDFQALKDGQIVNSGKKFDNKDLKINFRFKAYSGRPLNVRVSVSTTSAEAALNNMAVEMAYFNFAKFKKDAEKAWKNELGKYTIISDNQDYLTNYYTALYHTMTQPNIAMDVDGSYRSFDKKIYKANGFNYYSVFSLWDTFRTYHPLMTITNRKRTADFIKTFLAMYQQGGRLPVWELAANETDCMIGYHSVSVITDAYKKGITDFDGDLALNAMLKSATWNHLGLPQYIKNGYLSIEDEHESVSKTLEYAYDDWCIAQMAKAFKNDAEYSYFSQRAQGWKHIFDNETKLMRPRINGGFISEFDPRMVTNSFTEANSWQYSFFVMHDLAGLIKMHGGNQNFEKKLDELFTENSELTGRQQADITGLIGQYAHGNEPSHHMAFLYHSLGKPHKSQDILNQIIENFYKNNPDGLIGNEDCGQMSAWLVMAGMGLYPVCPGIPTYHISKPIFQNLSIKLENNKLIKISTTGKGKYISSLKMNGSIYNKSYLNHSDLENGVNLEFTLSDTPGAEFGVGEGNYYLTKMEEDEIATIPSIQGKMSFRDSVLVKINAPAEYDIMFMGYDAKKYNLDDENKKPPFNFRKYSKPFYIKSDSSIVAYTVFNGKNGRKISKQVSAKFYKIPNNWKVTYKSKFMASYTADGEDGLIDGIRGSENWRKGFWQGFQGRDIEFTLDLGTEKNIDTLSGSFLKESRSWIFPPKGMIVEASSDNVNFSEALNVTYPELLPFDEEAKTFEIKGKSKVSKARYLRVKVLDPGKMPSWHLSAGEMGIIFMDEFMVK